jgi:hypothetical protein
MFQIKFIIYKTTYAVNVVKLINLLKTHNCALRTPTEIHFIRSGNREVYGIFKIHAALSIFYFSQNAVYFIILSLPVQIIHFSQTMP